MAVSVLAFVVGFIALNAALSHSIHGGLSDVWRWSNRPVTGLCVLSLSLCAVAVVNLVRATSRGYSSQRCQLASVIPLLAIIGPILLTIVLVGRHCLHD